MRKTKSEKSNTHYQQGLTLIEVVICMAIFAVGFLAIAAMVISTTRNNTSGNMLTEATMLTRAKIEYLKSLHLGALEDACPENMTPEKINSVYFRKCEVGFLGTSPTIKTIMVAVTWEKLGRARQVVLETNTRGQGK
jgi:prepilin-type N-terminal cleavage/methylation domain-containing protein